jgi:hypothetical protein
MTRKLYVQILRLPDERLRFPSYGGSARAEGYVETAAPDDADLIILNTCHIREKAAEKVYSRLAGAAAQGQRGEKGAARDGRRGGCVAQAEGAEIIRRAPVVDLVVGPQSYHRLPICSRARTVRSRPSFRSRTSSTFLLHRARPRPAGSGRDRLRPPCRKAATSSVRSASCPTRAAQGLAAGREDPRRGAQPRRRPVCAR